MTIEPPEAAAAGVQWRRVGTETWYNSGETEHGVPVGEHVVEFSSVPGWRPMKDVTVTVLLGETAVEVFFATRVTLPGVMMLLLEDE